MSCGPRMHFNLAPSQYHARLSHMSTSASTVQSKVQLARACQSTAAPLHCCPTSLKDTKMLSADYDANCCARHTISLKIMYTSLSICSAVSLAHIYCAAHLL